MYQQYLNMPWANRVVKIAMIILAAFLLSLESPNWDAVIVAFAWLMIILSTIGIFGINEGAKATYERRGEVRSFLEIDDAEILISNIIMGLVFAFHGWIVMGVTYIIFKSLLEIGYRTKYVEIVEEARKLDNS